MFIWISSFIKCHQVSSRVIKHHQDSKSVIMHLQLSSNMLKRYDVFLLFPKSLNSSKIGLFCSFDKLSVLKIFVLMLPFILGRFQNPNFDNMSDITFLVSLVEQIKILNIWLLSMPYVVLNTVLSHNWCII